MAKEELAAWNLYVDQREAELPEKCQISEQRAGSIKAIFKRLSERKTDLLPARKVLDMHHQFISAVRFDIKIDPENMSQMIHPYQGYMCNADTKYSYDDIMTTYKYLLVSSRERALGQTLLANELTCLAYWNVIDEAKMGSHNLDGFKRQLNTFRFDTENMTIEDFKKEFEWTLSQNEGELKEEDTAESAVLRFDLMRKIFLQQL